MKMMAKVHRTPGFFKRSIKVKDNIDDGQIRARGNGRIEPRELSGYGVGFEWVIVEANIEPYLKDVDYVQKRIFSNDLKVVLTYITVDSFRMNLQQRVNKANSYDTDFC